MESPAEFYREKLYPLQDGALKIVRDLKLPFYLTGGTALSRYYLHHRFSDDLYLFVNDDPAFESYVKSLMSALAGWENPLPFKLDNNKLKTYDNFVQTFVSDGEVDPKIGLVNDVPSHFFEGLNTIKWIEGFDYSTIEEDFKTISEDIFYGNKNSLR